MGAALSALSCAGIPAMLACAPMGIVTTGQLKVGVVLAAASLAFGACNTKPQWYRCDYSVPKIDSAGHVSYGTGSWSGYANDASNAAELCGETTSGCGNCRVGRLDSSGATDAVSGTPGGVPGPSCNGLPSTCGLQGKDSCCTSLLVPGGTYNRNNDPAYPATVSDFALDKYEVTVGRFRAFVKAGMGTQDNPPSAGEGAAPLVAGSGWDPAWNTELPADGVGILAELNCDAELQTWTDSPADNENKPMGCITWYAAFAFCAWDGGRLPTDAEWGYAAMGGSEQRRYAWGNSLDCTEVVSRNCPAAQGPAEVGSRPAGNARWGHADLTGNLWEWNLDWAGAYEIVPCDNCAKLTLDTYQSKDRVKRGGGYPANFGIDLSDTGGNFFAPGYATASQGIRCARAAQ